MIRALVSVTLLSLYSPSSASEIDSFTHRQKLFTTYEPANKALDAMIEGYMSAAAQATADSYPGQCNATQLEQKLFELVGNVYILGVDTVISKIERDLNRGRSEYYRSENGSEVPIPVMKPKGRSIYNRLPVTKYPIPYLMQGALLRYQLPKNAGDLVVGTDKVGHFIQTGKDLLVAKRTRFNQMAQVGNMTDEWALDRDSTDFMLNYNFKTEIGQYGLGEGPGIGTGVRSYGDLAANYDGMRFWLRLTADSWAPFPGKSKEDVYFKCDANKNWVRTKAKFTMEDYVSPAWDEAINPSDYRTPDAQGRIEQGIRDLFRDGKLERDALPINVDQCKQSLSHYPEDTLKFLISPLCLQHKDRK